MSINNTKGKNEILNTENDMLINQSINNNEDMEENMNSKEEIKIKLTLNNKTFNATLENNETTKELVSMFPMTLNMNDLHSNEKYNYLDTNLTTNASRQSRINAGDIKLFGSNCLVVFYESFNTSYSYTNLGTVDDVDSFVSELGNGNITITFDVAQ